MLIELLAKNPLLLLFLISGIGFAAGKIPIFGVRFGVAAVLFAGLAISGLDHQLILPDIVYTLGLVLFVYTTGLSCGPTFLLAFRKSGLRDNALVLGMLILAAFMARLVGDALQISPHYSAGMFAGSLTNTPALAAVLEHLKVGASAIDTANPVVAYSLAYPFGVIGMIVALLLFKPRGLKKSLAQQRDSANGESKISSQTLEVRTLAQTLTPAEFRERTQSPVIFGRLKRGLEESLIAEDTELHNGDLVNLIGSPEEVTRAGAELGVFVDQDITQDQSRYEHRRIFVSEPKIEGMALSELSLMSRFGALVTRIRRGDVDFIATGENRLRLGDRVRVVAPCAIMPEVNRFFGDSYRAMSEIDIASLSLGLVGGLLLGLIPIPLPGGFVFKLGFAGGPLLAGIVLGIVGRTGRLCWDLPYSATMSLKQLGLVLFLAGVGTKSGFAFFDTLRQGSGLILLLGGAVVTTMTALIALALGRWCLGISFPTMAGILAGLQTQPALLAFAAELTEDERTDVAYSTVFPIATLAKLILVQWVVRSI